MVPASAYHDHYLPGAPTLAPPPHIPKEEADPDRYYFQKIVDDYHQYKWSIMLYSVIFEPRYVDLERYFESGAGPDGPIHVDERSKGSEIKQACYTAQDFVVKLISLYDDPTKFIWSAHVTPGFIKYGDIASLIIINNGCKPYPETTSSTTFGFHQFNANKITWWTVDPGMGPAITTFLDEGRILLRGAWGRNMRATEKRFHRAYWLAANDKPLGGLLNRGHDEEWRKLDKELQDAGALFDESDLDDEEDRKDMVINGDEEGYTPENSGVDNSEEDAKLAWMDVEAVVGPSPMDF